MKRVAVFIVCIIASLVTYAQENPLEKFDFLIGDWSGTGSGFGNNKSKIETRFQYVLGDKFIEVTNDAKFDPTEKKPDGEHHMDKGYISYDTGTKQIICRQFFIEGYVIRYVLNDSLSNETSFVFDSEHIENLKGGKARWTINKKSDTEFDVAFEVAFSGGEMMCLGTNSLVKKE